MVSLQATIEALRGQLAEAADAVVQAWEQDEDGFDEVYGTGGPCDDVASALAGVIDLEGVELIEGGQEGDDHAWWIVARPDTEEAVGLDVPARVYETGGGYSWTKVPNAKINPEDVAVWPIPYEDIREAVQDC